MKHAINELKMVLEIAKNNEPIQRAEGRIEQADLNLEKIKELQECIPWLEVFQNPPYEKPRLTLQDDIEHAINCRSAENNSDTPDYILAEYLIGCLKNWDFYVNKREAFYGRKQPIAPITEWHNDPEVAAVVPPKFSSVEELKDYVASIEDDDLGELDPSKACDLSKEGGCESCQ